MKIYFSVDNPKIEKRNHNRGEDAPVVNKDGIMIICDGTGATGQSEHTIGEETYTSAYLGSRETSKLAEAFLSENYERLMDSFSDMDGVQTIVTELGETIRNGLLAYVRKNELTLTVHGKSFKLLPTTFTAVVYKAYPTKIEVIVLCAGDSRALWWDTEGLHQLSREDSDNTHLSAGDCSVSNCVSADGDFTLSFSCYTLHPKGVLLATSDGFTDPIKPFEQERYLIEWIGNFDNVCEQRSHQLSAQIMRKMDDIGFTQRDDCSLAGVILGYSSENELKDDFRKRYKDELVETYLKPYKELSGQYREAEAQLSEAKQALLTIEKQIVDMIKNGVLCYVNHRFDTDDVNDDPLFQALIHTDAIGATIRKETNQIENDRKDKQLLCAQKEAELKDGYLEFLKLLCRDFGAIRFSDELTDAVRAYYETKDILNECAQNIDAELSDLARLPDASANIHNGHFWDNLGAVTEALSADMALVKRHYQTYNKNSDVVEQYFCYQNEAVAEFYREDIETRFAVLKKTTKLPLFVSKKHSELQALCQTLLRLYETTETLKAETTDAYIQNRKRTACIQTITRFCEDVAAELFYKDTYWEYIQTEQGVTPVLQLNQYKQRKNDVESLIAQRERLVDRYHHTYETYLVNTPAQGAILFGKEGTMGYANHSVI